MTKIPRLSKFDSTFGFLKNPYYFISEGCESVNCDIFQTRTALRRTVCLSGADAAEFFYNNKNLVRQGGMPEPLKSTLLGRGGVQSLDGTSHLHRKNLFTSLMTGANIQRLTEIAEKNWHRYIKKWQRERNVLLYDELQQILTLSICEWTGVPLKISELEEKTNYLRSMFDEAGNWGHLRARFRRYQAQKWIMSLVSRIRTGKLRVDHNSPLEKFAKYRDADGIYLPLKTTAVEVLNLLRPTVAVSAYILFVAHALYKYPMAKKKIIDNPSYLDFFVQEVRRFYPFFPAVAALAQKDIDWQGFRIKKGSRVLLDLNGVNHDPFIWLEPHKFNPDRFRAWNGNLYNFIPQGGGFQAIHHRCPGEWITLALMKQAAEIFTKEIIYRVPEQDLELQLSRLPPIPSSRFVISDVQYKPSLFEDLHNPRISLDPSR